MNKKVLNIIYILFVFQFIMLCFQKNNIIYKSILDSFTIFIHKVFPFLFITMILNNLLINTNLPYYMNKIFKNPSIYIFIISALFGCPINAIILKEYLDKNYISSSNASKILAFTTLNNPLFLYNYFKLIFINKIIIIKTFIIIYLGNIILLIIFYKKICGQINIKYSNSSIKKMLIMSITKSTNNLINIFGIIAFFKLICDLLINGNTPLSCLFRGLTEITQGLNSILLLDISLKLKELLSLVILSFAGFSIHIQITNILDNYPINYKYFYISRIFLISFSFITLIGK